ncbi:MAG TPA: glycosyltransferase [Longimicrobiales bacterium]|nr:glycosyltransferase [Longimicrobiales bacterium]
MTGDPHKPTVLIYRKRLLYWSETFIAAQGGALERYRPVYAGLRHKAEGRPYLGDSPSVTLEDHALWYPLEKAVLRATGRVPARWRRAIGAYAPTLVHAHFGWEAPDGRAIARSFGIPLIVTFHGMDITVQRNTSAERRQRGTAFREATRIIAVSHFIADRLLAAGAPADKVIVHYIGIDTDRFSPGAAPRSEREILFVGRLVEKKGVIHLLRAMPHVQAAVPGASLTIAGDGPLRPQLERAAAELGTDVRFLGVQKPPQVAALMRRAAVMCAPFVVSPNGNAEGLGLTAVEAQACGTPIVASPSGGSTEGFLHGETGFLVPPGDPEALTVRLIELLGNDELRRRFGERARAFVLERFDLRRQTAKLEEIYDAARTRSRGV